MGPDTVSEPARQTPVVHRADVLVVGSGPGGLAAALAAARAGVDVAHVERGGCFGGNRTRGGGAGRIVVLRAVRAGIVWDRPPSFPRPERKPERKARMTSMGHRKR